MTLNKDHRATDLAWSLAHTAGSGAMRRAVCVPLRDSTVVLNSGGREVCARGQVVGPAGRAFEYSCAGFDELDLCGVERRASVPTGAVRLCAK
jgi:hypothetical protein